MIAIIDYEMGNVGSIKNMLWKIGAESVITRDPAAIRSARKLILPGVGAFDRAIEHLREFDLLGILNEQALDVRKPVLGICLGMQLLTRGSEEGVLPGLGWIEADTVKFRWNDPGHEHLRLPHMGWNRIRPTGQHALYENLPEDPRFYFVHTYHVRCDRDEDVLATASYGYEFHASIGRGNIMGTQFHPEKSHKFGLRLLENFVKMVPAAVLA